VLGIGADDVALGSVQRSTSLVRIPSALAADLALMTDALDGGGVDIAATLSLLAADVAASIASYVGLSVRLSAADFHAEVTTLDDPSAIAGIMTSLRVPMAESSAMSGSSVVIVLYAAMPGAFVDLAADLAWLTGRALDDVGLDVDLGPHIHAHATTSLSSLSSIDQALGMLVGQGHTPEEALVELEALAIRAGGDRHAAAVLLLDALPPSEGAVSYDTE
jgi:hypothetical protein